jgi:hypothetical protein
LVCLEEHITMRFIKHKLLARRAKALASKLHLPRHTINYKEAKRIGILFETTKKQPSEWMNGLRERLQKEGKEVELLGFFSKPPQQETEEAFFTSKDISISGKIASDKVDAFVKKEFDYLYCISEEDSAVFDSILAESRAKCRVGRYNSKKNMLYELMIHLRPEDNYNTLVDEMLKFTKAIAYN